LWVLPASERASLLRRAVARGTRIRLRSIFLTTSTTVVGLAPLLLHFTFHPFRITFGGTEDRDIWENLALTSIGGLLSSTILLLFVLPPLYYAVIRTTWLWWRFWEWVRAKAGSLRRGRPETEAPAGA
jgi:multidrug efflux pump subunit AcrB